MSYKIRKAEKELEEYLEKHPDLIPMQNTLDEAMDKAEPGKRIQVLNFFIQQNLLDLQIELKLFKFDIDNFLKKR